MKTAFNEGQNISVGGNTVYVVQLDETDTPTGIRSVALGDCDPARGYTGPLSNPPGILSGDRGCGFAFGTIMWNTSSDELRVAGVEERYAIPRNIVRLGALARRGGSRCRVDHELPLQLREHLGNRHLQVLDRPRRGPGLGQTAGGERRTGHGRRVQSHRRRPLGEHRQPQQRGRSHGGRMGAHLLRQPEHAALAAISHRFPVADAFREW